MNKRYLTWLILAFVILLSAAIFTVKAAEVVFGNLPLVNSTGSAHCLGVGGRLDGTWDINFRVPPGRDYALNDVQFVLKIPAGNRSTTISGDFHLQSLDERTSEELALLNNVTVSRTTPQIYTLRPDRNVVMRGGRMYTVQIRADMAAGSCSLLMEASDTPPVGDFTYVDNIGPQMGRYVGFQLNATPLVVEDSEAPLVDEDGNFIIYPPDNRLNWQFGDSHIGILYGWEGGIGLYDYNSDSYVDFLMAQDIEPYIENLPAQAVLLAEYGSVRAYILPTGEIQFNLGPDAEGKEFVFIVTSFTDQFGYGYYSDPNE